MIIGITVAIMLPRHASTQSSARWSPMRSPATRSWSPFVVSTTGTIIASMTRTTARRPGDIRAGTPTAKPGSATASFRRAITMTAAIIARSIVPSASATSLVMRTVVGNPTTSRNPEPRRTTVRRGSFFVFWYNGRMAMADPIILTLHTIEDTQNEARKFVEAVVPETSGATLVTLSGELGAGKTTFTQFIAQALDITDTVNSPTFVIEKIYEIPDSPNPRKFERLIHIDAYRLRDAGDLGVLGFDEIMSHTGTLILLEWPEQVAGIAERASVRILLEHLPGGSRQITYA
jgi:tRNA threonylcarbamoyladenosine biosynthesis protein TsaE